MRAHRTALLCMAALLIVALYSWAGSELGLTVTDPLLDLG